MKRKKPLRSNPRKTQAWKERSGQRYVDSRNAQVRNAPMRNAPKIKQSVNPIPEDVREAVRLRANGRCETCFNPTDPLHLHHMRLRSQGGGHTVDNLLGLCDPCHREIHSKPKDAHEAGFIHSAKWAREVPWVSVLDRRVARPENPWA